MAFGNGSHHSLKRGFLRPNGGSRLPAFLIIALMAGCSFLLYNVYMTTVDRNALLEELGLTKKKWQSCQRDKTELETRFETHARSFKTMKDELERLRAVERSSNEMQKELKQCREQMVTLQNENADMKEEQKADVESCNRKLKATEEKLDPCLQDKSRLESEIEGLRSNLSAALQQAQVGQVAKDKAGDVAQQTTKVVEARTHSQEADNNGLPPVPPHRGAPEDLNASTESAIKLPSQRVNATQREEGNLSAGALEGKVRDNVGNQTTVVQSATDIAAKAPSTDDKPATSFDDDAPSDKKAATAVPVAQEIKETPKPVMQAVGTSVVDGAVNTQLPFVSKDLQAAHKEEIFRNENETSNTPTAAEPQVLAGDKKQQDGSMKVAAPLIRRRQKGRRLNKVVEASAPVDERPRTPSDFDKDRSRGEQDDAQLAESDRVTLRAAIPKRINVDDRPGQPSDHESTAKDHAGQLTSSIAVSPVKGGIDGGQAPEGEAGTSPMSIAEAKNRMFDHRPKEAGLAAPMERAPLARPKPDIRKGLKDDYQYRDDEEESEGASLKNKPKKAMANELDGVADAKIGRVQRDGVDDTAKGSKFGGESDPKTSDDERVAMKKGAKLADEDEDVEKNLPKDANADADARN